MLAASTRLHSRRRLCLNGSVAWVTCSHLSCNQISASTICEQASKASPLLVSSDPNGFACVCASATRSRNQLRDAGAAVCTVRSRPGLFSPDPSLQRRRQFRGTDRNLTRYPGTFSIPVVHVPG